MHNTQQIFIQSVPYPSFRHCWNLTDPCHPNQIPSQRKTMCKILVTLCFIVTHNTFTTCQYLKCSENYCLPLDYDKGDLPPRNKNQPLQVAVEFEIIHFSRIQDKEFWMEVVMWLSIYWDEPRLKFIGNEKPNKLVSLGLDFSEHIWVPDLYVYSLRNIKMTSILTQFAGIASLYGRCANCNCK